MDNFDADKLKRELKRAFNKQTAIPAISTILSAAVTISAAKNGSLLGVALGAFGTYVSGKQWKDSMPGWGF